MLIWLFDFLKQFHHGFAVFDYVTVRVIFAAITSFFVSLILGKPVIAFLQKFQLGQVVRQNGPQSHHVKAGTPTMGGVLIILTIMITAILWGELSNIYLWLCLFVLCFSGLLGFVDDYLKISKKNTKGVTARQKLGFQALIALFVAGYLYFTKTSDVTTTMIIPFFKDITLNLGWFFIPVAIFVIMGSSNSVNLTDGLDGLAILPVVLVAAALGVFAYLTSNYHFAHYLFLPYVHGADECVIICSALVGAGLGFLWFNAYPAEIFMGDVGSLALGSLLGTIAVMIRQEIIFFIMGGVFILETLSVILQVGSYKLRKKRIFKMAPIHHHFELLGWSEPKVIVRFWIITFVLVLIGLTSLKIR